MCISKVLNSHDVTGVWFTLVAWAGATRYRESGASYNRWVGRRGNRLQVLGADGGNDQLMGLGGEGVARCGWGGEGHAVVAGKT